MSLLDRAVKYNTGMRRNKKWIQKCRALVVAFNSGYIRLVAQTMRACRRTISLLKS